MSTEIETIDSMKKNNKGVWMKLFMWKFMLFAQKLSKAYLLADNLSVFIKMMKNDEMYFFFIFIDI